jgi:hypothetical protein
VQAPFLIDAPKPETESRFGSGHPGKPIFLKLLREEQVLCQASVWQKFEFKVVESTKVSLRKTPS